MGGDTKTEPEASPKVGFQGLSDEVRAEVASLVQAALAKMQQPSYDCSVAKTVLPVAEISTTDVEAEIERKYKEIVSALEAKLSETNKQLETTYRNMNHTRDQLEKQRAKAVQLEQRILQMSQAEGTYKSTLAVLRADKEKALAREREALLSRERTGTHYTQLSNKLSDLQSNLDLKTAELNDSIYIRQQLENRINDLNKENMSLRRGVVAPQPQGAPTGAQPGVTNGTATSPQSAQPPSNLYFSVPVAGAARRHTAPNIYPPSAPATQTVPNSLPVNRPPKRARADSNVSDDSNGTRSRASSGSSMSFALRPVHPAPAETKPSASTPTVPSSNNGYPQYQAYSPVSPTAPVSPHYTQQQQGTYASPIAYQNQGSYQPQLAVSQGPSSAPLTMGAPSITRPLEPTMVSAPTQMMQPAPVRQVPSVQQFINQMYTSTPVGFPECKICKVRPLGHSINGVSMPPSISDLLLHVEKFHGRTIVPKPAQQQQA